MKTNKIIMAACLMAAAFFSNPSAANAQVDKTPSVDIQATAQREVMPDELTLAITIKENDYKGKKSLEEKQKELIGVLKKNKIDYEEALTIKEMGSAVKFKVFSKNPTPRSEATYLLKLHDATTMQSVVCDLEEQHISNIDLIQTRYTKADELKVELGVEAIKKAKQEAKALAEAIGQQIGSAISINSWMSNSNPRPQIYKMAAARNMAYDAAEAGGAPMPSPAISGIMYKVNVSAKFTLKPLEK